MLTFLTTVHNIVFGDCRSMEEVPSGSIHLTVTSPPYFNAPYDYPGLFKNYDEFIGLITSLSKELSRVTSPGRIVCFVADDMLVDGEKYPVVADITRIMIDAGFRYRDRIVWVKPKGYVRISRRSGVVIQNPYPMYYYPDNLTESILIFQKGKFDYGYKRQLSAKTLRLSRLDKDDINGREWHLTAWHITNVLPVRGGQTISVAAFPEEIPRRLIKLYSYYGETVLDPFVGSGTTIKVAKELGRNSWGYELDLEVRRVFERKVQLQMEDNDELLFRVRSDARSLREAGLGKASSRLEDLESEGPVRGGTVRSSKYR